MRRRGPIDKSEETNKPPEGDLDEEEQEAEDYDEEET